LPDPGPLQISGDSSPRIDPILIIGTLLGAAIEEFTYRRVLQSFFCRRYGLWAGVIGVAIAFGAVHASVVIMLVGFSLALLYMVSGRLWVAIIAHTTGNLAVPVVASLPLGQGVLLVCCAISAALLILAAAFAIGALRR
jgi:membrane protease YdiL (CAAX protease family)